MQGTARNDPRRRTSACARVLHAFDRARRHAGFGKSSMAAGLPNISGSNSSTPSGDRGRAVMSIGYIFSQHGEPIFAQAKRG